MFFFSALLLLLFLCYVFLRVHLLRVLNKKRVMFSICPFVRSSVRPSVRLFVRRYQTYEYEFWIRINRTCCKSAKRFMGQGDKTIKRSKIKVTGSQNRPNSWPRYFKKTNEPISLQLDSRSKGMKRSNLGVRRSKIKVTRRRSYIWRPGGGIILDLLVG